MSLRSCKSSGWLLTLLVVICVAMMGQTLLLELHHHGPAEQQTSHCVACFTGPLAALLVSAILVVPVEAGAALFGSSSTEPAPLRVLQERRRGPPF